MLPGNRPVCGRNCRTTCRLGTDVLLPGTNRLKTDDEISKAAVKGIDAIKPKLDELKPGEMVSVAVAACQTEPPRSPPGRSGHIARSSGWMCGGKAIKGLPDKGGYSDPFVPAVCLNKKPALDD